MVGRRQVRCQERDGGERHRSVGQQVQHDWEPARCTRGFDAPIGRVLREMQNLRAVSEEGRAALAEIQPAFVQLRQQRNEPGRGVTLVPSRNLDRREQVLVRQLANRCLRVSSFSTCNTAFWAFEAPLCGKIGTRTLHTA